jgi:hypothetical protein
MDWRKATLSHLALWRRSVATSTVSKTVGGHGKLPSDGHVTSRWRS